MVVLHDHEVHVLHPFHTFLSIRVMQLVFNILTIPVKIPERCLCVSILYRCHRIISIILLLKGLIRVNPDVPMPHY